MWQPQTKHEPENLDPYDKPQAALLIVPSGQVDAPREVLHIDFTPSSTHVVATVLSAKFDPTTSPMTANNVFFWDARTLVEGHMTKTDTLKNSEAPKASGTVAFSNQDIVTCLFPRNLVGDEEYGTASSYARPYRLEAHDLMSRKRLFKSDVGIRAPIAVSREGMLIAGVACTGKVNFSTDHR